jgi:F-type H+-transporting ATPase subunit b
MHSTSFALAAALASPAALASEGGGFNPLNPTTFGGALWTLLIFLVAVPFIWKAVMGPIAKALVERDELAAQAIATAEKASADAQAARAAVEVKLNEAQAGAARLLSEARDRAEVREREILEQAKTEAASMVAGARTAIRAEQDKALATIRGEVVELSLHAASRVLGRSVNNDDERRFVSELVTRGEGAQA